MDNNTILEKYNRLKYKYNSLLNDYNIVKKKLKEYESRSSSSSSNREMFDEPPRLKKPLPPLPPLLPMRVSPPPSPDYESTSRPSPLSNLDLSEFIQSSPPSSTSSSSSSSSSITPPSRYDWASEMEELETQNRMTKGQKSTKTKTDNKKRLKGELKELVKQFKKFAKDNKNSKSSSGRRRRVNNPFKQPMLDKLHDYQFYDADYTLSFDPETYPSKSSKMMKNADTEYDILDALDPDASPKKRSRYTECMMKKFDDMNIN